MKKLIIAIVIIFVVIALVILIIGRTFYPDNIAETSADGGKKELKTRFYKTDPETVSETIKEIIPTLSTWGGSWKLVDSQTETDSAKIRAEIPVVVFTDDLEVRIKSTENIGETRVDVVSKSRVGQSDFGENARHIRQILGALDEKFGKMN